MFTCPGRALFILIEDTLTMNGCILNGISLGNIQTGKIFLSIYTYMQTHIYIAVYTHTHTYTGELSTIIPWMSIYFIKDGHGLCLLKKLYSVSQNEAYR